MQLPSKVAEDTTPSMTARRTAAVTRASRARLGHPATPTSVPIGRQGAGADPSPGKSDRVVGEALALLEDAYLRLAPRRAWTRGSYGRDRHGHPVDPTDDRAVRWCATGALIRAEFELHGVRLEPVAVSGGVEGSERMMLALAYLSLGCWSGFSGRGSRPGARSHLALSPQLFLKAMPVRSPMSSTTFLGCGTGSWKKRSVSRSASRRSLSVGRRFSSSQSDVSWWSDVAPRTPDRREKVRVPSLPAEDQAQTQVQ